jgi:hypothetical protein
MRRLLREISGSALGEVSDVGMLRSPSGVEGAGSVDALETMTAEKVSLCLYNKKSRKSTSIFQHVMIEVPE